MPSVAQLGSDFDSTFPNEIDTRQIFRNGTVTLPDSDTRLDAQAINGSLSAIINIETTLGANVQGAFASVAARLQALEQGGSALTNVVAFTSQTSVTIPGTAHQQGQQALLYAVYDAATPRNALAPETFSVYPTTYNATITFTLPQSGVVMVAALAPAYTTTFIDQTTLVVPGATHGLGQTYLFFQVYDTATPAQAIEVGSLSVHPVSNNVTITFPLPQSGTLVLAVGSPRYAQAFTNQTTVTVLGSAHGLASADLLHEVYDASFEPAVIQGGGLSVHPGTFDVALTFAVPQSGMLLLAPVPSVEPPMLLAVLPMARTVPAPLIATRTIVDETRTVQLATHVETLAARLQALETAYQTLLTQHNGLPPGEEPTP